MDYGLTEGVDPEVELIRRTAVTLLQTGGRTMRLWCLALFSVAILVSDGCGGGGRGGCGTPGSTTECSSGDICSNLSGDGNECRKICTSQADCPADQSCNGIANTDVKSCQPKSGSTATPPPTPTATPK